MRALLPLLAFIPLQAQTPRFEVATVRLPPPEAFGLSMSGGPGTNEPTRLRYTNAPLYRIFTEAYGLAPYQIVAPDWVKDARYDVAAAIPEGTTPAQFSQMLQHLLAERLNLASHRETREQTVYRLTVARNGSKLRPSGVSQARPGKFPTPIAGRSMVMRYGDGEGTTRMSGQLQTTDQIAAMLTKYVGASVLNQTGLTGQYDFELEFFGEDATDGTGGIIPPGTVASGPSIFAAIEDYLGLRLERARGPIEVLVVDRLDRIPAEN